MRRYLWIASLLACGGAKEASTPEPPAGPVEPSPEIPAKPAAPTSGAACAGASGVPILLVPDISRVAKIASDGTYVYFTWFDADTGQLGLFRLAKNGGAVEPVAPDVDDVSATPRAAIWIDRSGTVSSADVTLGAVPAARRYGLTALADGALVTGADDSSGTTLYRLANGQGEILAEHAGAYVVDGGDVYYVTSIPDGQGGTTTSFHRRTLTAPAPVDWNKYDFAIPVAIDEARFYGLSPRPNYELGKNYTLRAQAKDGASAATDLYVGNAVGPLIANGAFLYAADPGEVVGEDYATAAPGGIVRIAKDGSGASVLQESRTGVTHVVADYEAIFWTTDEGLYCLRF